MVLGKVATGPVSFHLILSLDPVILTNPEGGNSRLSKCTGVFRHFPQSMRILFSLLNPQANRGTEM